MFGSVAKQVTYLQGRLQSDSEIGDLFCFHFISFMPNFFYYIKYCLTHLYDGFTLRYTPKSWFHKTTPQCPSQSKHIFKVVIQLMMVPIFSRNTTTQLIFLFWQIFTFFNLKYMISTDKKDFSGEKKMALVQ